MGKKPGKEHVLSCIKKYFLVTTGFPGSLTRRFQTENHLKGTYYIWTLLGRKSTVFRLLTLENGR